MNEAVKAKAVQEFSKIQSNAEKVEFVESKTEELDTMPLLSTTSKNNNKAEQLRMQGNVYFESKQLLKAMEMYNQSICFAEANSEALGIGYANRSSIYFLWKKYELCLNNIELATANGCPHRLMNKLNNRKNDCVAAAKPSHTGDDDKCAVLKPILSFPPHPVVPFIADCLELRESSEFGRHIVTKIDLRAGQVVAIEENFCKILRPKFKYQRCTNCLREYDLNLFPCKRCTSAMFCGEKCAVEADQHFHRIECPIIEWLSVHFADEIFIHKAVRMTLRVINSFNDMDSLRSSIRKVVPKTTVFDLNHRTDMPANERYEAIRGLQTNEDKRTPSELWELAGLAAILYRILMNNTSLGDVIKTDPDKKVLKELLFRHILMWPTATIPFDELSGIIPNPTKDCSSYGDGLFAFHGLLNHSCEPNCLTVCFDRHSTLFVRRPIQAGEQLFISYGYVLSFIHSFIFAT